MQIRRRLHNQTQKKKISLFGSTDKKLRHYIQVYDLWSGYMHEEYLLDTSKWIIDIREKKEKGALIK
jgi:hypothetical protein